MNYMCYLIIRDIFLVIGHHNLAIQWNLSNPTHQGAREMGGVVLGCRNTQVLFQLTKYFGTINFCQMSQDVGKLRCRIAQVPLYFKNECHSVL
jgi:hypothetical protein